MAVSSTSAASGASIDVTAVVQQLMSVENRPLEAINQKITRQSTVISDLGSIKSKLTAFSDALTEFEDPDSYNETTVSTSNSAYVQASSINGTQLGNYEITVTSVASPSRFAFTGFSSDGASIDLTNFTIQVADGTEYSETDITADTGDSPTISDLADWINALGENVSASVVLQNTDSDGNETWALTIQATETGEDNAIVLGDTSGIAAVDDTYSESATNAVFTLNGVDFERASNTFSDVVDGLTIDIIDVTEVGSSIILRVKEGTDSSSTIIQNLVTAYNDLMAYYKTVTSNTSSTTSGDSTSTNTFANDPTLLSFITEIKSKFAQGASYGTDYSTQFSLSWAGIDMQLDGTLKFDSDNYDSAIADGLISILQDGVSVAYSNSGDSLLEYVDSYAGTNGYIADLILSKAEEAYTLGDQQAQIQARLDKIEQNLYTQYSALNALLFQLSSTSDALTSVLDGLNNNNN
jgi:flagellar hook-associated protein 2